MQKPIGTPSIDIDILKSYVFLTAYQKEMMKKKSILMKSYTFYMKYKKIHLSAAMLDAIIEFQYEETSSKLDIAAKNFAHCMILNLKPSNRFNGRDGTKSFFFSWIF